MIKTDSAVLMMILGELNEVFGPATTDTADDNSAFSLASADLEGLAQEDGEQGRQSPEPDGFAAPQQNRDDFTGVTILLG